jgi:hypothetical protein
MAAQHTLPCPLTGANHSSMRVWLCQVMRAEARVQAATPEFEARIAQCMQDHGVTYFGRLILEHSGADGSAPEFLTASRYACLLLTPIRGPMPTHAPAPCRYGSLDDAVRGTSLVRELMAPELSRWFSDHHMLHGTATRVLEL